MLFLLAAALLEAQFAQIAQQAQGNVGIAAMVVESGETHVYNGGARFPMQSVYKFPIAIAVLQLVDAGKLRLDQQIKVTPSDYVGPQQHSPLRDKFPNGTDIALRELLRYNVSESDGSACDVLLRLIGGPAVTNKAIESLGVRGMRIANTEREIGSDVSVQYRNDATPLAAVQLLKTFQEGGGLSKTSRELLRGWMIRTETGLKRLKGNLPAGTEVAHKTGTSRATNGVTHATNDIGLVVLPDGRHLAVAVFVADSRANEQTREGVIAAAARAAWDHFVGQEGPRNR
jgi:beta-lactamase class A